MKAINTESAEISASVENPSGDVSNMNFSRGTLRVSLSGSGLYKIYTMAHKRGYLDAYDRAEFWKV